MTIRLRVLGSADLTGSDGRRLHTLLVQPKRLALLVYFAVNRPVCLHRRDALLATFWPERSDEQARGALSQALSFIRRTVGDDAIVVRGNDEVGVDLGHVECDACDFENAADRGDHTGALALYAGDLLPAFHVEDCQPFETWLESERKRLRGRALASAYARSETAARDGDWAAALDSARRALALAPYDEVAAAHVLRALDGAGHRARALEEYHAFVARLAADLELQPSAALVETSEAIRRGTRPSPPAPPTVVAQEPVRLEEGVAPSVPITPPAGGQTSGPSSYFYTAHPRTAARRAYLLYVISLPIVALAAKSATVFIGLPSWVLPGALLVMALGLPALLFTHWVHVLPRRVASARRRDMASLRTTIERLAVSARPHTNWPRTLSGIAVGVGVFALFVGTFMIVRDVGIGPFGSLIATGKVAERERLVIATFDGPAADSLLRETITSTFRIALAQSPMLSVLPLPAMQDALERMNRPPRSRVTLQVAQQLAVRDGLRVVIDGEVQRLGGRFALSARLVVALTGEELAAVSETASDERDLVAAIGRLSGAMRERIGESLRQVRRAKPIERVTTSSLEALQDYLRAMRLADEGAALATLEELLDHATALDPGFAAASLLHASLLWKHGSNPAKRRALVQQAYDHRNRLTDAERQRTIAAYFWWGPAPHLDTCIEAYETLIATDPFDAAALNSLGVVYSRSRQFEKAEGLFERAIAADAMLHDAYGNLAAARAARGRLRDAEEPLDAQQRLFPRSATPLLLRAQLAIARGQFDDAERRLDSLSRTRMGDPLIGQHVAALRAEIARESGRISDALRWSAVQHRGDARRSARLAPVLDVLDEVHADIWLRADTARARQTLARGMAAHPIDLLPPDETPYDFLARLLGITGAPYQVAALVSTGEAKQEVDDPFAAKGEAARLRGHLAMAQHRPAEAIEAYRAADVGVCARCALPDLASAYEAAGNKDSVLAVLTRYLATPPQIATRPAAQYDGAPAPPLATIYRRLAELHEVAGDTVRALVEYRAFAALWRNADPVLQPQLLAARRKITRLRGG